MTTENEPQVPLIKLQSKDHEEILNVIDRLRSEGASRYINLPQIIVCGDQSSGKSSVLEAISGLGFPVKDNLCTRFPTELILRRASEESVTVSIHPGEDSPTSESDKLRTFKPPSVALEQFPHIVKSAEDFIGLAKDRQLFSTARLRVEVSGPTQPHLTLVDLPGLYHAPDEDQDDKGVELVEKLVLSYMENKRSVILAVISAQSDIALQKVTAFTRKADPSGNRTLGLITKPDTLPKGSDMERSFIQLASNKRVFYRLGWHVLRNRSFEERYTSLIERQTTESKFLSSGVWATLPRDHAGIESLRPRLSKILKDQIISQLPRLISETQQIVAEAEAARQRLGDSRATLDEQRRYLLRSSERYHILTSNAIYGMYHDPFFGDAMDDEGYQKRLRAVVQNRLTDFEEDLRMNGEHRKIIDNRGVFKARKLDENEVLRSDFVVEVKLRMRRSRGRELPGTFNPLIIGDLFYLQSRPWESIAGKYTGLLLEDIRNAIMLISQEVLDTRTIEGLLEHLVNPKFDQLESQMRTKLKDLLAPQQTGHPITYNHYFTDNVQKAREATQRQSIAMRLRAFFGEEWNHRASNTRTYTFSMDSLLETLSVQSETDMEQFACSEAIDLMQAYYKVARKKFVDDFSVLAVEKCLLEPLPSIYSPKSVGDLGVEIVQAFAAEDEASKSEREQLTLKIAILQGSLTELHRLDRHHLIGRQNSDRPLGADHEQLNGIKDLTERDRDSALSVKEEEHVSTPYATSPKPVSMASPSRIENFPEEAVVGPDDDEQWGTPIKKNKKKRHPSASFFE